MTRGKILVAVLMMAAAPPLAAQDGVMFSAGYLLAGSPDESTWRLTAQKALLGPIGLDFSGMILPGEGHVTGRLLGFGLDFTLFDGSDRFPAIVIGTAAGVGFRNQDRGWFGSSIGLRQPLFVLGNIRGTVEGRWRNTTISGRDGIELSFGLGWRRSSGPTSPAAGAGGGLYLPRDVSKRLTNSGIPDQKAELIGGVINTALDEMGQPYVWGGTGDGKGGFDCSGLIYYSYGQHGVRIPRTSRGQATAGVAIRKSLDALVPGDILTFATGRNDAVTHVGLYVGEGRFIHSASKGVRLSRLSADDPTGGYWFDHWVGVRRIVE